MFNKSKIEVRQLANVRSWFDKQMEEYADEKDPVLKLLKLEKIGEGVDARIAKKQREIDDNVEGKGDKAVLFGLVTLAAGFLTVASGTLPFILLGASFLCGVYAAHSKTMRREPYKTRLVQDARELMNTLEDQKNNVSEMGYKLVKDNMVAVTKGQMREGYFDNPRIAKLFAIVVANEWHENKNAAAKLTVREGLSP
ncbi:MAG: hypothetical protein V1721_01065 [Pseudomonadota bacterium]